MLEGKIDEEGEGEKRYGKNDRLYIRSMKKEK